MPEEGEVSVKPEATPSADPRANVAAALSGYMTPEQVAKLTDEILAIQKRAWADFECKACGQKQRQMALVPDAKAVTGALTDLMNQGFGRPQEASAPDEQKIVFTRVVNLVAPPEE